MWNLETYFDDKKNLVEESDFLYFTSFKYKSSNATLKYSKRLLRLVYLATMVEENEETSTSMDVIVKFTNTYGVDAHKFMAECAMKECQRTFAVSLLSRPPPSSRTCMSSAEVKSTTSLSQHLTFS